MKMSPLRNERPSQFVGVGLRTSESNDPSGDAATRVSRQDWLVATLLLLVICLIEVRILQIIQVSGFPREVLGAQGLLHGTPELRAFQNRVLGPIIVGALVRFTGQPYSIVYVDILTSLIAFPNFLCLLLSYRVTSDLKSGLWAAFCFAAAVVALQDESWFFLWDAIELSTMLIFAYGVFHARDDLRLFVPLFVVQVLNRESAEFIALWVIFVSAWNIYVARSDRSERNRNIWHLLVGLFLLVFGAWWTHTIRKRLFQHSFDKHVNLDLPHRADGQWFTLVTNLHPDSVEMSSFALAVICCLAIAFVLYRLIAVLGREAYPVVWLLTVMVIAVWLFGRVVETRVWLEFVPFGILYLFTVENQAPLHRAKPDLRLTG
jgi:hypothetical protein